VEECEDLSDLDLLERLELDVRELRPDSSQLRELPQQSSVFCIRVVDCSEKIVDSMSAVYVCFSR